MTRPTVVRTAVVRTASTVTPKQVRWLWEPRIPLGKLTILAGAAGQGKSQTTTMLAALTSKGAAAGDLLHTCGDVLMVSAEDDFEDTVVPRLIAAGAQLERVHGLDMQEEIDGIKYPSSVSLPGDAARIHQLARDLQVKLVALDPVSGLLDEDHSAISNQQVRRALAPIKAMAEAVGCAVVAVMHTNKANGTNALARIADSGAFTAFARSVMFMGPDPSDPDGERGSRKVLALPKSNLAIAGEHSLSLRIESTIVDGGDGLPISTSLVVVEGVSDVAASDLLQTNDDGSTLGEARAFLRGELMGGARPAKEVKAAARDADIADRTLRRARELECDVIKGHAERGVWLWRLKKVATSPVSPHHGQVGHLPAPEPNPSVQLDQDDQDVQGSRYSKVGHLPAAERLIADKVAAAFDATEVPAS